jgi:transposase
VAKMATKQRRASRARRQYTDEFKAGAVRLVLDEGKTVADVARDLDLTPSALGGWVKRARADRSGGKTGPTSDQVAELAALRKELRVVTQERDILKKAVAFFAKENG